MGIEQKLFVNNYNKKPLIVESGSVVSLFGDRGRRYLDFISGISINNLGFSNEELKMVMKSQIDKVVHASNYYFTESQINLAKKLVKMSSLDRVFFSNSGTEANEAALVFIKKYHETVLKNQDELISFNGSFVGRTYGSRSLTNLKRVEKIKIKRIPLNDCAAFLDVFSSKTLAVHVELLQGHGGIRLMDRKLVRLIQQKCKKTGCLIFVDEVQTGLGRCGSVLLSKKIQLKPDILTLAKSLGGGFPLAATLMRKSIADVIKPGDHGCTMGGNSVACAAGCYILDYLDKKKNIRSINEKADYLFRRLKSLQIKYKTIIEIRGMGLMLGIEVGLNANEIVEFCFDNGLLLDVVNKNVIRMLPPFIITKTDIDFAITILEKAIKLYG
ncbi:TPA: aspartate aminotransferase family protein [Candidatus Falkowbacteria bacterium]|nr:aspartate aminotransferase family protein [Candidatus Falkowbacteria bacterium]